MLPVRRRVMGVRESWTNIAMALQAVQAELQPNAGSSLRDAVNSTRDAVIRIEGETRVVRATQRAMSSASPEAALVEFGADGTCEWANQQWLTLAGQEPAGAAGWGWLNAIHQNEREAIREEWMTALDQQSQFVATFTLCRGECAVASGCTEVLREATGCASVRCVGTPVVDSLDRVLGYVAVVERI